MRTPRSTRTDRTTGSRPFTLEAEGGSLVTRGPCSIDLGFTVVEDSAANGNGDGGKEPAHSSGIFSTSDFSVDPPLPVRSFSSSTRRSEPRARSEGAGQFFRSGGAVQQQATSRSPRASYYGGVERDGGGSIASRSGTSSDNGRGGRAWVNDDAGSLLRVSGSSRGGLGSTSSSTPAAAVPPRYPGGGGGGGGRDSCGSRLGRAGKRGGGSSSTSGSAFSEEGLGNPGGESGQ